jgi:hypothetical protein
MTVMPWDEIPDSNLLPTGSFNARGAEMEIGEADDGRLIVLAQIDVTEPADYASFRQFERFYLGTEDDPKAKQPATWKRYPAQRIKQLFNAAQVPPAPGENGLEVMAASFSGSLFGFDCLYYLDDGKNDPQYKGQPRNKINAFWRVGEKQPAVDARSMRQPGVPRTAGPVTAPPLQPAAVPQGFPQANVPPAQPATVPQPQQNVGVGLNAAPAAQGAPLPGQTAGPPASAPMTAAPPTPQQVAQGAPAPQQVAPPAQTPPAQQPAVEQPGAAAGLIPCTVAGCGQMLTALDFAPHIAWHQSRGEV